MAESIPTGRSIILLRHTSLARAEGLCYGRSELALADSRTTDIASVLAALPVAERIVSSPSQRCRELAMAAFHASRGAAAAPQFDPRWLELDFGRWEGLPWDAVPRAELDAWAADTWNYAPGGGESARELYARVAEALQSLRAAPACRRTLLVTHAGPLRAAAVLLRGLDFTEHFAVSAATGAWVELPL